MYQRIYSFFILALGLLLILKCAGSRMDLTNEEKTSKLVQKIQWPNREYPSIQSAVDALEDGGKLELASGKYRLKEPLVIIGKQIVIEGASSTREIPIRKWENPNRVEKNLPKKYRTRLIGSVPRSLVKAEKARGAITFIKAGGEIRNLEISGYDAGIISRNGNGLESNLMVDQVIIENSGMGILFKSSASLTISNSQIYKVKGNGISYFPREFLDLPNSLIAYNNIVKTADSIGYAISNTYESWIGYNEISGCKGGGIVGYKSGFNVFGCMIINNNNVGVAYIESQGYIIGNYINNTFPRESDGKFGDGIAVLLRGLSEPGGSEKPVHIYNNTITNNDRAGLSNFGGHVKFSNNYYICNTIHLNGEVLFGKDYIFTKVNSQFCYDCDPTNSEIGECQVQSGGGLEPPEEIPPK